ncbi:MAG: glycosyltransferase [Balneolaceae bacterium]|nr:MAG: glycosyltransferase [Balneolaceae bacterium]
MESSSLRSPSDRLPLISIITVVYNGEKYLEKAIHSVVHQTGCHCEFIVVDGGSTDGTLDIIKKNDDKIDKWISEPDKGIYDAMNKGIKLASGTIIGILNADDEMNEGVLKIVGNEFSQNPNLDFLYGYVERMTLSGDVYDIASSLSISEMDQKKFQQIPIPHGALFVKKQLFHELGYYKTDYIINSDYDFILRLLENGKKGKKINLAISRFRDGGRSSGYLTFWERRRIMREFKVPFIKREYVIMKGVIKLFIAKLLPNSIVSSLRKKRTA